MAYGKTIIAEHAAVASEQPLASMAGYDVLKAGGNAFDAAVATAFALAVTFHPAGGLGGDFFGMFYDAKSGKVKCLNSSGWSPSGLTSDLVMSNNGGGVPQFGPLTSTVPAFVAGVHEMHRALGSMEFKSLLSPAARYASEGFPAGEGICRSTAGAFAELSPEAKRVFAPSGSPPAPGEWIKQRNLGSTISDIAAHGPEAFYAGAPAKEIAGLLESLGVTTSQGDFSDFKPEWVQPLVLPYRGTTVYEVPPNSMGATTLLILKMLSESDLPSSGPLSRRRIDLTMDAVQTAYRARDEVLADPRFADVDLDAFMSRRPTGGVHHTTIRSGDTTAFSVADSEGNVVSGIQSLFHHFGSRVFAPGCGVMLNNRGSGFRAAGPNVPAPRKRPLNTLSSLILEKEGVPYLAIGASGGDWRPMQHTLFVTNAVDYKLTADQNVAHPRFLWGGGKTLMAEQGYEDPDPGKYDLQRLPYPGRTGVCHAVELSGRFKRAVCDPRGDGIPAGY